MKNVIWKMENERRLRLIIFPSAFETKAMIETVGRVRQRSAPGGLLKYWAPPIVWMSVIFFFSTDAFSGDNTGSLLRKVVSFIYPDVTRELFDSIHLYVRKGGHFTEYAVLAWLLVCSSGLFGSGPGRSGDGVGRSLPCWWRSSTRR